MLKYKKAAKRKRIQAKENDCPRRFYTYGGYEYVADYFFMLCTTLSKPQTMEISMPSNDKNITEEQQSKVKASQAITLLLAGGDKLYYYEGEPNYKDYTSLKETSYNADGLRSILLKKNSVAVREVNELKKQKADLKISEEDYTKKLSEIKAERIRRLSS